MSLEIIEIISDDHYRSVCSRACDNCIHGVFDSEVDEAGDHWGDTLLCMLHNKKIYDWSEQSRRSYSMVCDRWEDKN